MKPILTREYNVLKEMWKHSNSAWQMLFDLPQEYLPSFRTGLHMYVEWLLHETADAEEIDQFGDDNKARDLFCDERIRDGEITEEQAHRELASALWLNAIRETQFQEHMDAQLASKLREFIHIRDVSWVDIHPQEFSRETDPYCGGDNTRFDFRSSSNVSSATTNYPDR